MKVGSRGITLVETLAAIGIIVIVAAIAWAAIGGRVKAAGKQTVVKSDLKQIVIALNLYRLDHDDGFPSNWRSLGYYAVNKKDKFGLGFPPKDITYDNPPKYDVSFHTPECAAPPAASPDIRFFRQLIAAHQSRPRQSKIDFDNGHAVSFGPICEVGSLMQKHPFSYIRDGEVRTVNIPRVKSLGLSLSGSLSYQWWPDWSLETQLGN